MAASALFILDLKGRVILSRDYRGDVAPKLVERFISRVNELEDTGEFAGHLQTRSLHPGTAYLCHTSGDPA